MSKTLQPLPEGRLKEAFGAMRHPRDFRPFVPAQPAPPSLNTNRRDRTAQAMDLPLVAAIHDEWGALMHEPFVGLRIEGATPPPTPRPLTNGAPRAAMEAACHALLAILRPEIAEQVRFATDAREWRRWHNMPLQWPRDGIGLEEMTEAERAAVMDLAAASLSPEGFRDLRALMAINRFSGDLIGRPAYLNEHCYQFGLFGTPGDAVWGWQLYGHHIALNCVLAGDAYVLSPTFLAAEPTLVDEGPWLGTDAFLAEEEAGLALIRGLSPAARARAVICPSILNGDVPEGRRHWADSLHLAGAFRDNLTIPAEGLAAADMTPDDRDRLLAAFVPFFRLLPEGPRAARLAGIAAHLGDTRVVWMGGYDDWSPFYFRLQNPVALVEFDHHAAVFLTNGEPARFHVHTLARTPFGGDYGMNLRAASTETRP